MAAKKKKKDKAPSRIAADNRKARHLYSIQDEFEAGIVLTGTEIKSLRSGEANIRESYAEEKNGELWLINAHIPEFSHGNRFNHQPRRPRKLLMHKREISRLGGAIQREGMTLVPLRIVFNEKGRAKLELGLGKGKKLHDKRETEKQRDWNRQKARLMKDHS
ncbi:MULTISPECIES: SsrA-binding protein SmpB [Kordiimonas]|uniref:SsrA-binding protein SmpB n=1 Tax=Kordiimonas TaxID=288021 RepID=UPI001FF457CF|nr:SsrA-binding protein SmpB [Kordiimonas sp. SCSIO 12603]MCK0069593.1 SsrA-binding protein SmpB [Kordiimonas laminariae]UTW57058.1 SsrA-binding protein SmpB [Kordiimonas sp. SCSIO 12603]